MKIEKKLQEHEKKIEDFSRQMIIFTQHTEHLSHIRKDLNELKQDEIKEKEDIKTIIVRIEEHIIDNNKNFLKTFSWQERTDEKFNNHLVHLAGEQAKIQTTIDSIIANYAKKEELSKSKTNISWLKDLIMIIIGGIFMYFFNKI